MYILTSVVERIKQRAKVKNKSIAKVLEECGLNKNTLVSMNTRGSWIQANSLGMIADTLECSVDYLLCRTENPGSHNANASDITVSPYEDRQLASIIKIYEQLDDVGRARLLVSADEILKTK